MALKKNDIDKIIAAALKEDIQSGDITTNLIIPRRQKATASFIAKDDGIIAGLSIANEVFKKYDKNIVWKSFIKDGGPVKKGMQIAKATGNLRALLICERTALNLLQRLSGIATSTSTYVDAIKNTGSIILDTRKTAPGLRVFDKYAVKTGGGKNHRIGLFDMVLIKDNHIKAAGSIAAAVLKIKNGLKKKIKIEVETTTLDEVREALKAKADIIMLDNMTPGVMKEAVKIIGGKSKTEASGNVNLETVRAIAETGVDYISIGALTHSVKALDISMKLID